MTNEHLAALSDADTPGEWGTDCADHDQPYLDIKIKSGHRNIATVWIDDAPVPDYNQMQKANAALIVALVNAYRAGQIAVIGPDAALAGVSEKCRHTSDRNRAATALKGSTDAACGTLGDSDGDDGA